MVRGSTYDASVEGEGGVMSSSSVRWREGTTECERESVRESVGERGSAGISGMLMQWTEGAFIYPWDNSGPDHNVAKPTCSPFAEEMFTLVAEVWGFLPHL